MGAIDAAAHTAAANFARHAATEAEACASRTEQLRSEVDAAVTRQLLDMHARLAALEGRTADDSAPRTSFQTAIPTLPSPLDLQSWLMCLGTPSMSTMAAAAEREHEALTSHCLRAACSTALNAFILTHNVCVTMQVGAHVLSRVCEPSLRCYLALRKALQAYVAPRPRKLHESFVAECVAALVRLPDFSPAAIDGAIRSTMEAVGSEPRPAPRPTASPSASRPPRPAPSYGPFFQPQPAPFPAPFQAAPPRPPVQGKPGRGRGGGRTSSPHT
jgi:hypothetical protein